MVSVVPRPRFVRPFRRSLFLSVLVALGQFGCESAAYLTSRPGQVLLEGATLQPQFVTAHKSLPAVVRYWIAEGETVDVRWQRINAGENCDLCGTCTREDRPGVPTAVPDVLVMSRGTMSEEWKEAARLNYQTGCGAEPSAGFVPSVAADYAAALRFPGDPLPTPPMGESGTRLEPMPAQGIVLPLRRLTRESTDSPKWTWRVLSISGGTLIKEAFDPRLHVAKVRVLQATCNGLGPDPRGDECGNDDPMDEKFERDRNNKVVIEVVAPVSVRVGGERTSRTCRADPRSPDGDIDFGMKRAVEVASRCLREDRLTFFTPAYFTTETAAGPQPVLWTVELSAEVVERLPPSVRMGNESKFLWIEFTLEPTTP